MQNKTAVNPFPVFKREKRGKDNYMNNDKTTTTTARAEQPDFEKRIGKTTYRVKVHFNPNARETMSDKIIRMLRNEVQSPKM